LKVIFIDIDNTLLSFDGYVRESMRNGFREFGLRSYEPWMYDVFKEENDKLWCMIERKELVFEELIKIRWNNIFKRLGIDADGPAFETYFRSRLNESAIPVDGAMEMLEALKRAGRGDCRNDAGAGNDRWVNGIGAGSGDCESSIGAGSKDSVKGTGNVIRDIGRYILAAASNGPYHQQIHRLELCGMDRYLDYVFISEKVGYSKPAKEFFEIALREINMDRAASRKNAVSELSAGSAAVRSFSPGSAAGSGLSVGNDDAGGGYITAGDCVMVGDSLTSDMAGGRNAGMYTCYYRRNRDGVITGDVDIAVDDLRDVAAAIISLDSRTL